jgi:hypothetical protein
MKCFVVLSAILAVSMAAPTFDGEFDMNNQEYHHKDFWNSKPARPSRPENDLNLPEWLNNMWNNNGPQVQPTRPWERPQVGPVQPSQPKPWPISPMPDNIERPGRPGRPGRPQHPEFVSIQILRELFQQFMNAMREQKWNNNNNSGGINIPPRPMPIQPVVPYGGAVATATD